VAWLSEGSALAWHGISCNNCAEFCRQVTTLGWVGPGAASNGCATDRGAGRTVGPPTGTRQKACPLTCREYAHGRHGSPHTTCDPATREWLKRGRDASPRWALTPSTGIHHEGLVVVSPYPPSPDVGFHLEALALGGVAYQGLVMVFY
jgi:hypothetical protein